jgi:hypothetical protein
VSSSSRAALLVILFRIANRLGENGLLGLIQRAAQLEHAELEAAQLEAAVPVAVRRAA